MRTLHHLHRPEAAAHGAPPTDDRAITRPDLGLFGVVDGFGGPRWSSRCAAFAARRVVRAFAAHGGPTHARLAHALADAHEGLLRDARLARGTGGATATLVALGAGEAHVAHLGAGRLVHVRGGRSVELARDDRLVAVWARVGGVAPEGVRAREVTTALGCPGLPCVPAYTRVALRADDHLVLATDGFTRASPRASDGGEDEGLLVVVRVLDPGTSPLRAVI